PKTPKPQNPAYLCYILFLILWLQNEMLNGLDHMFVLPDPVHLRLLQCTLSTDSTCKIPTAIHRAMAFVHVVFGRGLRRLLLLHHVSGLRLSFNVDLC
ncbi:MAG: hypothetical protein ACKO96_21935, partial [Flammeovirgaceae bacterium]